jgi:hypothetical protein
LLTLDVDLGQSATYRLKRCVGLADKMELVHHDLGLRQFLADGNPVRPPHVHGNVGDFALVGQGPQEGFDGGDIPVRKHVYQCPALDVGEDRPKVPQLDLIDSQPNRRFALKLLLHLLHIGVEHVAHGLFIHTDLFGHFGIGVFQRLTTHPIDQALGHLAGGIHLGHRGSKVLVAWLATQAGHVQVNGHAFAVGRQIPDEECFLGVQYRFMGSTAMWALPRDDRRFCLDVVVDIGFLEVQNRQAGEVQDVDGHGRLVRRKVNSSFHTVLFLKTDIFQVVFTGRSIWLAECAPVVTLAKVLGYVPIRRPCGGLSSGETQQSFKLWIY